MRSALKPHFFLFLKRMRGKCRETCGKPGSAGEKKTTLKKSGRRERGARKEASFNFHLKSSEGKLSLLVGLSSSLPALSRDFLQKDEKNEVWDQTS